MPMIKSTECNFSFKMKFTVCAFTDNQSNSVAYKKFDDIDKAVAFYRKQLEKDNVHVISTRKINERRSN